MKRHWKIKTLALVIIILTSVLVLKTNQAAASNPSTISFQGKVVNANGTNVADGSYGFVFKLYTAGSGGSAIWTESDTLTVSGGVFQVNLGAVCPFFTANACNLSTPIDFNANPNIYLGITFNSDPAGEMTPRVQLQSVPYAFNSDKVGGLTASQLVQLSPGTQQTGFVNVSQASTFGGGLTVSGTSTFNQTSGQSLTFSNGINFSYIQTPSGQFDFGNNSVWNGTNNVYASNGASSLILQGAGTVGIYNAPSGTAGGVETFSPLVVGLANGNVGVGTGGPNYKLDVQGGDFNTSANIRTGGTIRLDNSGDLSNIISIANSGNYTQTGTSTNTFTGDSTFSGSGTGLSVTNTASVGTLTVTSGGAGITGNSTVTGNLAVSGVYEAQSTTGTAGQGYFIQNSTPNNIASFQALDLGGSSFGFIGVNKYYNGSAWVDDGLGRVGSSFQIQNDSFTFYSFNTGTAFTSRFSVASGGDVGIGANVTPAYLLDVEGGDINTSANLRTGGTIRLDNAGNLSNIGTISASGAVTAGTYNGQTITSAANLTGTLAVASTVTGGTYNGQTITSAASFTGTLTVATNITSTAGNLTVSSGLFNQTFSSGTTASATTHTVTNSNSSATAATINGIDLALAGHADTTANSNTINGIKLENVTAITNNTFNAINVGTGFNNILQSANATITAAGVITGTTLDATTNFSANGTVGQTFTCAGGDYINTAAITEGIVTNHSACTGVGLSDSRVKTDIIPITGSNVLDALSQVNPVTFSYDCSNPWFDDNGIYCNTEPQAGVLAQQLMQIFPNLVNADQPDGYYSVNYTGLSVYTLEGVIQLAQHISSSGDANFNSTTTGSLTVNGSTSLAGAVAIDGGASISGNLSFNSTSGESGSFSSAVITPTLVASGGLVINSGSNASVAIDSPNGSVNVGTNSTSNVNIGNNSSTTTINGQVITSGLTSSSGSLNLNFNSTGSSLNINDANSSNAISAAINVSDSSGNGYNNIISASNFTVGGNGNISTNGSIVVHGGAFDLYSPSDNLVVSFDNSGDADFSGNLNMQSASLSGGLTVGGNVNVAGLSTFQQLATFLAKTVFNQDVQFNGHITVNSDTAGYASLRTDESTVHVNFTNQYASPPVVTSSIVNGQFGLVSVNNVTSQGFDLSLSVPAAAPTTLSWTAVGVTNPQTATNPLPNQSGGSSSSP